MRFLVVEPEIRVSFTAEIWCMIQPPSQLGQLGIFWVDMKPSKALIALHDMQAFFTNGIGIAKAEGREVHWKMLRNVAALEDAIGVYGKLLDFIARQRAEGGAARLSPDQWDAWCMEVLGDLLPQPAPVDVVAMMGE